MTWERPFTAFGILLILMGITLVLIPLIVKLLPEVNVEKIPWFILYIYHTDGFFFATSPLLIIISIISFLWALLHR